MRCSLLVCALIAAMWVYAFVFASKKGIYFVDRQSVANVGGADLHNADPAAAGARRHHRRVHRQPTHAQMPQRADIVDRATDILERMLNEVVALPLSPAPTIASASRSSRRTTARSSTTAGPTPPSAAGSSCEPYRETLVHGGPVSNIVTDFTTGNAITHCMPPGELGGDA